MRSWTRPPISPAFEPSVIGTRSEIRKLAKEPNTTIDFPDRWKKYKDVFARVQHGKCGYCELFVIGGQPGDVEHFWPKGAVWSLREEPSTWGKERAWSSSVEGRRRVVLSDRGYWWKAYDWGNYLLSCAVCNEFWKQSYFPVDAEERVLPPDEGVAETHFLLNPFEAGDAVETHFSYSPLGEISPRNGSRRASETIHTCGLHRESLIRLRREKASRTYALLTRVAEDRPRESVLESLADLLEMGADDTVHSGMVRSIFEEVTGLEWSVLESLLGTPNPRQQL